jgi:hypothetical protein
VLCGVPADVDVALSGWQGADTTGIVIATAPLGGLSRRDLQLRGSAVVRGTIRSERNQPIANGRIGILGRERSVSTDSAGAFHFGSVPAGSQTLEFRAIGFAPEQRVMQLRDQSDTTIAVTLTSMKTVLDTIQIVAQRWYDRDVSGFLRRKRSGNGHFFDEETIRRRRPITLYHLLFSVPSVRVMQVGFDRKVLIGRGADRCQPDLFVNGMQMNFLLDNLEMLARPEEVVGMEIYRGPSETPAEFSRFGSCGAIVVWTRPAPKRR